MRLKKSVCLTLEVAVMDWLDFYSLSHWKLEKVMTACSLSFKLFPSEFFCLFVLFLLFNTVVPHYDIVIITVSQSESQTFCL